MDMIAALGLRPDGRMSPLDRERLRQKVDLHLLASGMTPRESQPREFEGVAGGLLDRLGELGRLLTDHRCPADQRIEAFLRDHFADVTAGNPLRLPGRTLVLDQHGMAREMALPAEGDTFSNELLSSYRVRNGVLHNPKSDRRTTQGTFHVVEGGLPIPGDKLAVPRGVFAELFRHAVNPPDSVATLPYTAGRSSPTRCFVSLLLRPVVCPEVPGVTPRKTMECRFFAPGSLVSNLDFVESIFGNAGDPFLPCNDAGLDAEHWTGHTGCVILAPHLVSLTKKQLGLPRFDDATERQQRDGMCWKNEQERYNNGTAFKLTCRALASGGAGVIVTLIADNYFGYCKKEVKTQVSFAANLYGNVEEEHAGGAVAFAGYSLGFEYLPSNSHDNGRTFDDLAREYGSFIDFKPQGYGIDKENPDLVYIPHDACASTIRQEAWWTRDGREIAIPLSPEKVYMTPSGFKVHLEKHPGAASWRLIGTNGHGVHCHKPCTVSGGGKSEISKSLRDYMIYGPIYVSDLEKDLDLAAQVIGRDYSDRWKPGAAEKPDYTTRESRPLLSPKRTVGSVIKLLTPSPDYTEAYNAWLASIPAYIYPIVFIIKRFHRAEWGDDWRSRFSVDVINGFPGHELKMGDRTLVGTYLRVGLMPNHAWRTFKVRQDFAAAAKLQTQDDISASVVVPTGTGTESPSRKYVVNCEYRLFQRPDDAVHRGLDKQTELDMARPDNFISNFEPLTAADAAALAAKVTEFDQFTPPMQRLLRDAAEDNTGAGYVVSSAHPRLVDGKPSKNPRYLQTRPDLMNPLARLAAERGVRLFHAIPADRPALMPVDAVLVGRRNNPAEPEARIRGLAVYNPIHYQELPELFMDFICSLTGKSPSTTGAGSEGALTKSPFNALRPIIDLNNALVSYILTGLGGFSTSAGHVGPRFQVDHDISLLVPEVWCRLSEKERDPRWLIAEGHLEPVTDFQHAGETILASRLGYRITERFVRAFFGRIFDNPNRVFDLAILRPETQDLDEFADGVKNITQAQRRVAQGYLDDGSIDDACPPLRALLMIMATGSSDGRDARHPDVRGLFTRQALLASDWYRQRLECKRRRDESLWRRHTAYLDAFLARPGYADEARRLGLRQRRDTAAAMLERTGSTQYLASLVGALGADPSTGT